MYISSGSQNVEETTEMQCSLRFIYGPAKEQEYKNRTNSKENQKILEEAYKCIQSSPDAAIEHLINFGAVHEKEKVYWRIRTKIRC